MDLMYVRLAITKALFEGAATFNRLTKAVLPPQLCHDLAVLNTTGPD